MNNNYKSATVAGLLGIFLGSVGAHDWYLGDKKKGTIHVCLAASGLVLSIVASVILPSVLTFRALLTWGTIVGILGALASLVMCGNGIWGFIEGVIILSQGDAGLARKGYMVAPSANCNNNFGGQQNMGNMQNNMNGMNNMNGGQNMSAGQNNMNGNGGNNGNNSNNINNGVNQGN